MSRVEQLEKQIADLDPAEMKVLREWFQRFDAETWDQQIASDAKSGKLLEITERVLRGHKAGHSTEL